MSGLNLDSKSLLIGGAGAFAAMTLLGGKKSTSGVSGLGRPGTKKKSSTKKASTGKRKTAKRK